MTKTVTLGEICNILSGFAFDSELFNESEGMPLVRIRDVGKDQTGTFYSGAYSKRYVIEKGDMLIGMDGDFRIAEWRSVPALLNQRVCKLEPITSKIDPKFLLHFLPKKLKQIEDKTSFATVKHLSVKGIQSIEIPLPSLLRQRQIAATLDRADALRQKDRQLLVYYDQLAQGTFMDLFGDPVQNEKGWQEEKMESLLTFMTSGSRGWADYYSDLGSKFLRIQNVGRGRLKLDDLTYVNAPNTAEAKRTKVQAGDVLLSITADLGRTAVIPENFGDAFINQHLALLRFPKSINPVFISALLTTEYGQRQIGKADKGGVKAGLNFNDIKSVLLLLPPLPLQQHFATIIERIEQQKAAVQQQIAASEALFQRLLQDNFGE